MQPQPGIGSSYRRIPFVKAIRGDSAADRPSEQDFVILNPHQKQPSKGEDSIARDIDRFDMQAKQPRELFKESDVDLIWKSIQKSVRREHVSGRGHGRL